MGVLLSYVLLGLSLAAPIGPVNAAQLGIKFGFLHAWLVGVGAVLADGVYMLIVYLGQYPIYSNLPKAIWMFCLNLYWD